MIFSVSIRMGNNLLIKVKLTKETISKGYFMDKKFNLLILFKIISKTQLAYYLIFKELLSIQHIKISIKLFIKNFIIKFKYNFPNKKEK
jgi:hypothetical protein